MPFNPITSRAGVGGTFGYMAPELFSECALLSKEADMYGFGMVIYEVITGTLPFGRRRVPDLLFTTVRPDKPEDPVAIGFGQGTWEFTEGCWDENPERRPTAREASEHFEHVARTSTVVNSGPTIRSDEVVDETPMLDGGSRGYCKCRGPDTVSPF